MIDLVAGICGSSAMTRWVRTLLLSALLIGCSGSSTPAQSPTNIVSSEAAFKPTSFKVEVSGTGRPMIFLPGLTCDGTVWDGTVAHLGGKVRAHVLSLAGFAGTPPIDKALLPTVRDELIEYILRNHLDHPILVGHSLGAFVTFWVAETAPHLVGGGVAVDGAPFFPALMDPKATVASSADKAKGMREQMGGTPEKFTAGVRAFIGAMVSDADKHSAMIARWVKSDPKTSADAMYFLFQTDLRPDLGKITAPMLVIAADGKGQFPRADLEATWNAEIAEVPHHKLVVIDNAKHFLMLDQPDAFYAALDAFLAQ
jgi:pimeloyl-ACP methyl ester carboxylesterase